MVHTHVHFQHPDPSSVQYHFQEHAYGLLAGLIQSAAIAGRVQMRVQQIGRPDPEPQAAANGARIRFEFQQVLWTVPRRNGRPTWFGCFHGVEKRIDRDFALEVQQSPKPGALPCKLESTVWHAP
jgi:hypothetical protein